MPQIINASSGSGGFILRETQTASNSASLACTAWQSSIFDTYQIQFLGFVPATTNQALLLQFSTNGGSSYDGGANYAHSSFGFTGVGDGLTGNQGDTSINVFGAALYNPTPTPATLSSSASFVLHCGSGLWPSLHGTSYYSKHGDQPSNPSEGGLHNALYKSTTQVNAFRVTFASGNIAQGIIRVYGFAKS